MSVERLKTSFDEEANALLTTLPARPTAVVIGSTSFWHNESPATCSALGSLLASIPDLVLITGGMTGVGEGVGRSFFDARRNEAGAHDVFHILPHGCPCWDYGITLFAGSDMAERREVLGRLSWLYLAIEGGPGTVHEGRVALSRGAVVIPVGRSGGYAGEVYPTLPRPTFATEENWRALGNSEVTPDEVAKSVHEIVFAYLQSPSYRHSCTLKR